MPPKSKIRNPQSEIINPQSEIINPKSAKIFYNILMKLNLKSKSKPEEENPCEKKIKCKILQIEETKYRTTFTKKFENRKKYVPADPKKVYTYLPGTILDVFIKAGQKVKMGDALIVFEAMKMKNKIISPADGKIRVLSVSKGDIITKGQLIAELE